MESLSTRLDKLAGRLMATTEHAQYAQLVLEAVSEIERLRQGWIKSGETMRDHKCVQPEEEFAMPNAIWLAKFLHDTYERLAPEYGYVTRPETRTFDHESANGRLMIAACEALRSELLPQDSSGPK